MIRRSGCIKFCLEGKGWFKIYFPFLCQKLMIFSWIFKTQVYDWLILPLFLKCWNGGGGIILLFLWPGSIAFVVFLHTDEDLANALLLFQSLLHHPIFIPKSMLMKNLSVGSAVPKCVFLSLYLNVLLGLFHFCKKKLIICWQALVCIFAFLAFHKIEKIIHQPRKIC